MADIDELRVKLTADIKELRSQFNQANVTLEKTQTSLNKVKDPLSKVEKGSKATADKGKILQNKFRDIASSAAILEGPLGGVAGRINTIGAALGRVHPLFIAFGIATAGMVVSVKKSIDAFEEHEKLIKRVDSVLRATGRQYDLSAKQADKFAVALGEATLTSREEVLKSISAISTFSNVATDDFEAIITRAQDMSAVFGGDLKSNTLILARALQSPAQAFELLERRVGKFTEAEKQMLIQFERNNDLASAQQFIFNKLNIVMGAATDEANSLAGAKDTLGERLRELGTTFSDVTGIADLYKISIEKVSGAVKGLSNYLKEATKRQQEMKLSILNKQIENTDKKIQALQNRIKDPSAGFAGKTSINDLISGAKMLDKALLNIFKNKPIDNSIATENKKLEAQIEALRQENEKRQDLIRDIQENLNGEGESGSSELDTSSIKGSTNDIANDFTRLSASINASTDNWSTHLATALASSENQFEAFAQAIGDIAKEIQIMLIKTFVTDKIVNSFMRGLNRGANNDFVGPPSPRASGGPVDSNSPFLVGEQGPELFVPRTNGQIVNNNKLKNTQGSSRPVNVTINQSNNYATGAEINDIDKRIQLASYQTTERTKLAIIQSINQGGAMSSAVRRR